MRPDERTQETRISSNTALLTVMEMVPRELFLMEPSNNEELHDSLLPIGFGRVLLSPSLVAQMLEQAQPLPEKTLLEVSSGTGYISAISSFLFRKVVGIEVNEPLAAKSRSLLFYLGLSHVKIQDETHEQFDSIIVSQPVSEIPTKLFKQLAPSGRLVFLLETKNGMELMTVCRDGKKDEFSQVASPVSLTESMLLKK